MKKLCRRVLFTLVHISVFTFFFISVDAATQVEEGFRWRNNFNVITINGSNILDADATVLNIQKEHEDMNNLESFISHHLPNSSMIHNIVLAGISIVYEDAQGSHKRINMPILHISNDGEVRNEIAVFVSGTSVSNRLLAPQRSLHAWLSSHPLDWLQGINTIKEVNGSIAFPTDINIFYETLRLLFVEVVPTTDILDSATCIERRTELTLPSQVGMHTEAKYQNLQRGYHHSEQWLLHYLGLKPRENKTNFMLLVDALISAKMPPPGSRIKAVILHIHSKNDVCKRCTQTINRIIQEKDLLVSSLKRYINEEYNNNTHEPQFLVLASSRVNNSDQKRREKCGHDHHFNDSIDIQNFVPYFAQTILSDLPVRQEFLAAFDTP